MVKRRDYIAKDVVEILMGQKRHLSASGITQVLVCKFNRKKSVGSAISVGKMLRHMVGHNGIMQRIFDESYEYWYDENMHLCHSTIDFGRFLYGQD